MSIFQRFLSLLFLIVLLGPTIQLSAQTYQIQVNGSWVDLGGATIAVCPNTDYDIRIGATNPPTFPYTAHLTATSAGAEFDDGTGMGTYTGTVCGTANASNDVIATIRFTQTSNQNINISQDAGSCSQGGSPASYNFNPTPVGVTMPGDQNICIDSPDEVANATCIHCNISGNISYSHTLFINGSNMGALSQTGSSPYNISHTIASGNFTALGTVLVEIETNRTDGNTGAALPSCTERVSTTYTVVDKPGGVTAAYDLTASTLPNPNSPTTATAAQICIDGSQGVDGGCTTNCPSTEAGYTWVIRDRRETGTTASANVQVFAGTSTGSGTAVDFDINPTNLSLAHGTYDVLLIVTNDNGCASDPVEIGNGSLIINDKPGVEIFHNRGIDWSQQTSNSHGVADLCTGQLIQMVSHNCDHDDFIPGNYPHNNTDVNNMDPNTPDNASTGDNPYTTPCSGQYFAQEIWRAKIDDGMGGFTYLDLDPNASGSASGVVDTREAIENSTNPSTVPSVTVTPSAGNLLMEFATMRAGTIYYELEATGFNGCSNTDTVEINVVAPTVTFEFLDDLGNIISSGNTAINKCEGSVQEIRAYCDICLDNFPNTPSFTTTWENNAGANPLDAAISGNVNANPVVSQTLILGNDTRYFVAIEDANGCRNDETNTGRPVHRVNIKAQDAPDVTGAEYSGGLCDGRPMTIQVQGTGVSGFEYDIYDDDPAAGGNLVYSCVTCTFSGASNDILETDDQSASGGTAAYNPVDGTDYYIVAKLAGGTGCSVTHSITRPGNSNGTADVGVSPNTMPSTSSSVNNESYCNSEVGEIYLDLNGGSTNWNFTWSIVSQTPSNATITNGNPTARTLNSGSLSGFTNGGSGSAGFWGFLIGGKPDVGASFPDISPTEYSSIVFRVVVDNGTCTQTVDFDPMEIVNCEFPVLEARSTSNIGVTTPSSGWEEVDNPIPFDYVCEGGILELQVNIPSGNSGFDFEWSSGETTRDILINVTAASPDTIVRTVDVKRSSDGQLLTTLEHKAVVSRGDVNFYPQGDNDPAVVDTAICENESIYAQANCPTCYGELEYIWDGNSPGTATTNGTIYQGHSATGATAFDVELQLNHGEFGACVEYLERRVEVATLPTVETRYNGTVVSSTGVIHRCDGQPNVLEVECVACPSSTFDWNTGATTPSININAQGGYYAIVSDQNSCRKISEIVVIVDALDGQNAPVTAWPAEICATNPAVLQVAPCIGCSYQWYEQTILTVPPFGPTPVGTGNRVESVTTPGVYFAEVTNPEGCTYTTQNLNVTTNVVAIPAIQSTTDTLCDNQTATLWTSYMPGFTYQWYMEDAGGVLQAITGATDSSYTTLPGAFGVYQVRVTYNNGCEEESPLLAIAQSNFTPTIASTGTEICTGETVDLSTPLVPGWRYQWRINGNEMLGETGSIHYADSAASYYAEVTNYNGCKSKTPEVVLTKTELFKPNATTNTPTICPGELGRLSVSLCVDCEYEWFDVTPTSLSPRSATGFNYNSVTNTGDYYAVVYKGSCSERSDTVSIVRNAVFTPSINSISSVVCTGRDAVLTTQSCVGCSYSWLKDSIPALGAINDTFHIIDDISNIGVYNIAVDYPNGCSDTSAAIVVTDGSYTVSLAPTTGVICNGAGETISASISPATTTPGVYTYTLFIDNTAITGYTNVTTGASNYDFLNNTRDGAYTVEVTNPDGCIEISTPTFMDTVNIIPTLSARATEDPNSVPASAICTDSGRVFLEVVVPNCPNCTYAWEKGGLAISHTLDTLITLPGSLGGADIYVVYASDRGCTAPSNPITILDNRATFNSSITPDTTSICNGQSTTLSYNGNTCTNCSYRWLRTKNPINGANSPSYVATLEGDYNLEITTLEGCVDTSEVSVVLSINRPDSFRLQLDTVVAILGAGTSGSATPIAASATPINLNSWVFPDSVRNGSLAAASGDSSYFTSAPFNAALNCGGALICNPGLSGADSSLFTPADSLVGNHLISYHYIESGCEFIVQDVLRVLPAATISITNNNAASVPYEACIGDNLSIRAENLKFRIEEVYVFDANGDYQLAVIPANSFSYDTTTYGSDTFYTSTIVWTVPGDAYASYLNLKAAPPAGQDTILTPFLLIHNTDLSFAGLPSSGELCSNGERLTLFGNPQGGTFSVRDLSGAIMPGTIVGDSLYPTAINTSLYNDTSQLVDVVYSYRQTYTNGNNCVNLDFVTQRIKAIDVQLTNVDWNPISVSQDQELLTNLVFRVQPYNARANKQDFYTSSFSGSFTSPAGAPEYFLPNNAGVGRHALTYTITHGTCSNSIEDSIQVVPAPTNIAIPDTICRDFAPVNFRRDLAFPFSPPSPFNQTLIVDYTDSIYAMRVRGEGVVVNNSNPGSENFTYVPTNVVGNYDTLVIEYVFYRDEDTLGVDFDTLEYVVASIVKPIYVEDLINVEINDTIVQSFYCQDSALSVLTASPPDSFGRGLFMLFGGTGQYQFGDTLFNNVINPYQVNNSENATTTYDLIYILNGAACQNSDTMPITISKGLNPSFATVNGLDEFCETDPAVAITHNVLPPDTAIWKIGGIPQPSYSFNPTPLNPGIHVVDLQQIYTYIQGVDTFVCSALATDTFTIHALPNISVTPSLDKQYCANDPIVDFVVSPSPDCPMFGAAGQYLLDEDFNAGVPASWIVNTIAGKPWAPDALYPQGGTGLATFVDTSSVVDNSWLISPSMNLIAGHSYRLSYMVLAGPANANCGGGCVASLYVGLGNSTATTSITTQLDYEPQIDNDLAYQRHTVDYYHNPAAGATTGTFHLGFRNFSPANGRSLRLDNVEMRDLTVDSCMQAGLGYLEGPGAYKVRDSLYQFDPLSAPTGNITVKYVYTNTMGCQDSVVFPIQVDTAPVVSFTNLDSSYCENEPTVMITGSPLGGTFTSTRGTNLYDDTTFATLSPAFYPVSFQTNTPGLDIVSYTFTDNNNCSATAVDSVYIVRLLDRNVITGLNTRGYGYCIIDSANVITVTNQQPLGSGSLITSGTFYGPGVRNGAAGPGVATFHSDSAVIDMGHTGNVTISYIYTTTTQCQDTAFQTFEVHASPDLSFVNLPDSLCLNADSFRVVVQNRVVTGPTGNIVYIDTLGRQVGQFTETDIYGNPVDDFIQLFDTLYPYEANGYAQINVSYYYITDTALGACEATLEDSVRIDSVPIVYFQGLRDHYCENDPISIFLAFPSFNVGSGYLLIDSNQIDSSFYWIDPAVMVGPGQTTAVYPTYYTFTDSRGCQGEVFDTFEVRPYPRITFSATAQDTFCRQVGQRYDLRQLIAAPIGGFFTDNLALTSIRDSFYLDLGSQPGPRIVTYNYLDPTTMCQNSDSITIYLFSAPELDFTVYGGCSQMDITFDGSANNLIAGIDSITRIWWDFEGNGVLTYTQLDTTPITIPDTTYQYSSPGTYNVTLYVQNQGACVQSVTKPLIISPYHNLTNNDYFEDFNAGAGDWYNEQPLNISTTDIWTYEPSLNGAQINSPDGAWVTRADSLYQPGESAWVYSPCFDFTNSVRPMIAFDLWRDLLKNIDGVIMEYYDNNTNTWERLGDVGEGISWYQSNILLARPGNQQGVSLPRGWTGRSGGYESARLRLDQFKGQRDIRLRIAFATSPQTVIDSLSGAGFEGAAFDNVWVGERTRNVLVEHFSNQNYVTLGGLTSDNIDAVVYNKIFNSNYGNDVVLLQYQVDDNSITSPDPVYQSNSADLGGRSFDYATAPGEILIDGRLIGTGRSENLDEWEMDYDMLQFPSFEIRIDQPITIVNNTLSSNATVEALEAMPYDDYIIHMAIMQDSFTYNARNFNMLSIVRKMEPNNTGVPESHDWVLGQTATIAHSWDYTNQLNVASFNPDQLEVVVFIQNDNTDEVYQVATTQDMNRYNGTQTIPTDPRTEIFDLTVYPNPSSNWFNVSFDKALQQAYNWRLVDVTGRTLQMGTAEAGTEKFTIDANKLTDGAYFFVINSEDNEVYAQRKLIVIKR